MSSGILQCWISPEVEFTSVMTDFPNSAIERMRGALNRLVSDVMINWRAQRARRNILLIPSASPNVFLTCHDCNGMSDDNWYFEDIKKKWCYGTWGNNQYRNIRYRLKFILKRHVFVLHVTSVNTASVQVTHRAVGARTMHGFAPDLVSNPASWLVESRD